MPGPEGGPGPRGPAGAPPRRLPPPEGGKPRPTGGRRRPPRPPPRLLPHHLRIVRIVHIRTLILDLRRAHAMEPPMGLVVESFLGILLPTISKNKYELFIILFNLPCYFLLFNIYKLIF